MLQYYLRAEGLALSWVGTGRLIFSLNYTDADFAEVANRFVAAATKMKQDGWWWHDGTLTNKSIRRQILKEMLGQRVQALSWIRSSSCPACPGCTSGRAIGADAVMPGHSCMRASVGKARQRVHRDALARWHPPPSPATADA